MATGSGTGTPVSTTSGQVSSATLATLRDRVELMLADTGNAKWSADEIDEAITQALHRYSVVSPARTITSLTLTVAGREVDISALTYLQVERVWFDYDSDDPDYPPQWRDFELWPGDKLFIRSGQEPAVGDVVRVWYTHTHTLEDLASATTTTFPASDDSIIVLGGAAICAWNRTNATTETLNVDGWVPKRMRLWAEVQEARFEEELKRLARREAARHSGIAPTSDLDRWDTQEAAWW